MGKHEKQNSPEPNSASIVAGRYSAGWGIRAKGDFHFIYSLPFKTYAKALWYGNAEFGPGEFSILPV